jgi:hypothetical protein
MAMAQTAKGVRRGATSRGGTLVSVAGVASMALVAWGWSVRREVYLNAEFGPGYALGILGTAMMALLLVYSLRKRLAFMRSWGRVPRWLDAHMTLGLLGPTAILFHANFKLGSLNSTVALCCVLVVATSGVVGRMIYPKIHRGLSGRRADVRELREAARAQRGALGSVLAARPELAPELSTLEELALGGGRGAFASWRRSALLRRRAGRLEKRHRGAAALRNYTDALRRVAEFRTYERLFGLWHAFHLPFCIMLFAAAVVHVIAVHMY